ncbi:T9SS type A sorting domain-containing protein [Dyadobacter flavalbus]|uniref:T9SS type A sorting domain-containing protein n=1 Tax=Dyadobacter flavalbus TaxID=2579942 RepID=A0A5M8QVK7_9BACT|nr:T9SS type A sorting domain-containing protein [Dyadobacter flavalbus]KAA6440335.1 T9SS type A sorting domain-containing protein [Dyadobacter flavalbus]
MKFSFVNIALLASMMFCQQLSAQDVSINILGQPNKLIKNEEGYIAVKLLNESFGGLSAPANKLRPTISVPEYLDIIDVTNDDGTPLTGLSIVLQNLHSVKLLYNIDLAAGQAKTFRVIVKGAILAPVSSTITASLSFNGPQTVGNHPDNDNSTTGMEVIEEPQPVTLTDFRVQKEEATALLEWETTEETNSDRFEVQKSADGKKWETFQIVAAQGESKSLISYSAVDKAPFAGENFYRLHMIDKDGTSAYSRIRKLYFDALASIALYPNPVSDMLSIDMADWSKVSAISVSNTAGRSVYKSQGSLEKNINVKGWPAGIYLVQITFTGGTINSYKLIVTK